MAKRLPTKDPRRQRLSSLENPYAYADIDAERDALRVLENPYVYDQLAMEIDAPQSITARTQEGPRVDATPGVALRKPISKLDFRRTCTRIFAMYSPELEKGALRQHHRDFIARNENRSGTARAQLLTALSKYDLSTTPGLRGQFNRERNTLAEEKLRQIEQSVDAE